MVAAVKQGNLLRLNEALEANEKFFIKCGIYLILEKLKIITYRNLFKKVRILIIPHFSEQSVQIFFLCFRWQGW